MAGSPHPWLRDHLREVDALRSIPADELKEMWVARRGVGFPKYMRRELMARAVAHALREEQEGPLDPQSQRKLDILMATIQPVGATPRRPAARKLKVGTKLVREWQGALYEVIVRAEGFAWQGEIYRSLSEIARLIAGTRWNGWVFFGLKGRKQDLAVTENARETRMSARRAAHG